LLGAFCVVALHSPLGSLPNSLALIVRLSSRWAVPFFFLVTGYFIAQSLRGKQAINCSKSLNSLLAILLVANAIYSLFYWVDGDPNTTVHATVSRLLVGQSGHLWYLGASIGGLLLLQYLASRYSDRVLLAVGLVVLAATLAGYGYTTLTGLHLEQDIAHFITAIPFLFGGFLLARHSGWLRWLPLWACWALAITGFLLEVGEAVALYKLRAASPHNQELLLGTALMALGFFCISLKHLTPSPTTLAVAGKAFSLPIYLYHPLILACLYSLLKLGTYSPYLYWLSPVLGFSLTLLVLKVIERWVPRLFAVLSGM
jgi:surface polysaccharide O-acyltransferase-like enzyme